MSFHRLARPVFAAAAVAAVLAFVVGETLGGGDRQVARAPEGARGTKDQRTATTSCTARTTGWVYTIRTLDVVNKVLKDLVFLRQGSDSTVRREGNDPIRPYLAVSADSATYDSTAATWRIWGATSRVIFQGLAQPVFTAQEMRLRALTQRPAQLLAEAKTHRRNGLPRAGRVHPGACARTGNDVNKLRVEHALKIAIPVTCLIIALFGAPLSLSSPRAGAAFGIAISLGTTVLFLLIINLAKAVGKGGRDRPRSWPRGRRTPSSSWRRWCCSGGSGRRGAGLRGGPGGAFGNLGQIVGLARSTERSNGPRDRSRGPSASAAWGRRPLPDVLAAQLDAPDGGVADRPDSRSGARGCRCRGCTGGPTRGAGPASGPRRCWSASRGPSRCRSC